MVRKVIAYQKLLNSMQMYSKGISLKVYALIFLAFLSIIVNGTVGFRHSFATHRIYQWHKEGKDIDAFLPGLSAYMGHSHYSHTLYYLHLLPEIFSDMTGFDFERFSSIIPEVDSDD